MIVEAIFLILGIFFLIKGADFLVEGATTIARRFGISALIIGLTIVAFGTSMPELFINIIAAANGTTGIAIGNIIGSNIANILLVLGIVALIKPIRVKRSTTWREIPYSFLAGVLLLILVNISFLDKIQTNFISRSGGLILLSFFIVFLVYTFSLAKTNQKVRREIKMKDLPIKEEKTTISLFLIIVGIVGLYLGGKWTVDSAIYFTQFLGLSQYVISATVIAIGTSLPESATGITAARRGSVELAIGNSVGSNLFNILLVLGITAIVAPVIIPTIVNFDIVLLLAATLLLWLFMFVGKKKRSLEKYEGYIFLVIYVAYIVSLVFRG